MPFSPENNNYNDWYQPVDPRENIYTAGYGWAPKPPHIIELQLISRSAVAVVMCLLGYMFLDSYIYHTLADFFNVMLPMNTFVDFSGVINEFTMMVSVVISMLLPFSLYAMYVKIPLHCALPVRSVPAGLIISATFVCLAVTVLSGYCADSVYYLFDAANIHFYDSLSDIPSEMLETVLYCVNTILIAPIIEEIAFRGFLMQSLRRFGDSFALIVSAVLFGLLHVSPVSIFYAIPMGLVMGYFVLFTGSLHTAMIVHFINNLLAVLLTVAFQHFPESGYLFSVGFDTASVVLGILAVIWLMRHYENIFSLKSSQTVNRSTAKIKRFFVSAPFILFLLVIIYQAWGLLIW